MKRTRNRKDARMRRRNCSRKTPHPFGPRLQPLRYRGQPIEETPRGASLRSQVLTATREDLKTEGCAPERPRKRGRRPFEGDAPRGSPWGVSTMAADGSEEEALSCPWQAAEAAASPSASRAPVSARPWRVSRAAPASAQPWAARVRDAQVWASP